MYRYPKDNPTKWHLGDRIAWGSGLTGGNIYGTVIATFKPDQVRIQWDGEAFAPTYSLALLAEFGRNLTKGEVPWVHEDKEPGASTEALLKPWVQEEPNPTREEEIDPRKDGFNYGIGWGSKEPFPEVFRLGAELSLKLNEASEAASRKAWGLDHALRDVRHASTKAEKVNAILALQRVLEEIDPKKSLVEDDGKSYTFAEIAEKYADELFRRKWPFNAFIG